MQGVSSSDKLLNSNEFGCKDKHEIYEARIDSPKCLNVFTNPLGTCFPRSMAMVLAA